MYHQISLMYFDFCSLHDGPNGSSLHSLIHACLACVRHKKCNQQPHIEYNLYINQKYTNVWLLVALMKAVKGVTRGYWHVNLLRKVNISKTDNRSQMKPCHKHETIKNLLCSRHDKPLINKEGSESATCSVKFKSKFPIQECRKTFLSDSSHQALF